MRENGGTSVWRVHISDPWFGLVQGQVKTIEGRLYRDDYALMRVGDVITFCNDKGEFSKLVAGLDKYSSFEAYLTEKGLAKTLPGIESLNEGVRVYYQYYSAEDEEEYGVLAITLEEHG